MTIYQENPRLNIAYAEVNYNEASILFNELKDKHINLNGINEIRHENRKTEWMLIRKILHKIHQEAIDVIYDEHGKPHLKDSSDHSKEMVAVAINELVPTGIDIQFITNKVVRIKHKFLNEVEQQKTTKDAIELSYYWSCKEALFKVYGKKDAFLKDNFHIEHMELDSEGGIAEGIIKANSSIKKQKLKMRRIGDYVMAYAVNS